MTQLQGKENCPRCTKCSMITDNETAEVFCSSCGFVVDNVIFDNSHDRVFLDSDSNKSQIGDKTSLTRHDFGLSTIINPTNKDASGKIISTSMKSTLKQLRILDSRSQIRNSKEKSLRQALSELLKIKEKLSLSNNIAEKAAYIYRKILEKKLTQGRSISAIIMASVYVACRELEVPRTLNEISKSGNIRRKEIISNYKMIIKELNLNLPVSTPFTCVGKIANNAGIPETTKRHAIKLLEKAQKSQMLDGKDPVGMAAAALYLSSLEMHEKFTQLNIAKAANTSDVTVRNRSRDLQELL